MAESKATVPEFTLTTAVDMSSASALRAQLKEACDPAPSFNDMIVRACALALREFPRANGAYRDGHFELYSRVNVGIAVAAQDTLVVPTVFDADQRGIAEIAVATRELAGRVRSGEITPPELSGGTFTVSNLGMYGITSFTAVINSPQAAILAVGAIDQASLMRLTLTCDHRILYGADAAQFLARIRELLEQPVALLV
jgi:pyruvate dehydrogenase E2 component (dihydrolipoamide acetyltransferase)